MWSDPLRTGGEFNFMEIICGACAWKTVNLNLLHIHLTSHKEGGNYVYHHAAKTAYPINNMVCSSTQTEAIQLVDNASQTDEPCLETSDLRTLSCDITAHQTVKSEISGEFSGLYDGTADYDGEYSIKVIQPLVVKTEPCVTVHLDTPYVMENHTLAATNSSVSDTMTPRKEAGIHRKTGQTIKTATKRKREAGAKRKTKAKVGDIDSGTDTYCIEDDNGNSLESATVTDKSEDTSNNIDSQEANTNKRKQDNKTVVHKKKKRRVITKCELYEPPSLLLQCHLCPSQYKSRKHMHGHIESRHAGAYHWKCGSCRVPFVSEGDYLHHVKQCKDSWGKCHTCSECNHQNVFLSKKLLLEHLKQSHGNVFPLSCSVCNVPIASEFDEREHMFEHDKDALKCRFCWTVSTSVIASEIHMMSHVRDNPFTCYICDRTSTNLISVQDHVYNHFDADDGRGAYICESCGASFAHSRKRYKHLVYCRKVNKCKTCELIFPSRYRLKQHERVHNEQTLVCEQCGQSFAYNHTLSYHKRTVHSEVEKFTCSLCKKSFICKSSLDSHLLSHDNILPYPCEYCQKKFRDKKALQRHIRQHTGEKPYVCTKCGLTFAHNVSRKNHEAKCTGTRQFLC